MARQPEPLRGDVQLTSGYKLVLLWHEGEYYIRLLRRHSEEERAKTGKACGFATRWLIVTPEFMLGLKAYDPTSSHASPPVDIGEVQIRLDKQYFFVRFRDKLAGSGMSYALTDTAADLIATVETALKSEAA